VGSLGTAWVAELKKLMVLAGVTNEELSGELGVARYTVARWCSGRNLPHELARPNVLNYLLKKVQQKEI
jgi:transcriptional regulator with XRE-family HTH domain